MRKAAGLVLLLILSGAVSAEPVPKNYQPVVDRIEASIAPAKARRGETVVLRVHLDLKAGAYALPSQTDKEMAEVFVAPRIQVLGIDPGISVGLLKEPKYRVREVPEIDWKFNIVEGPTTWEQTLVVAPQAKPGDRRVSVKVVFQIMDVTSCRPPLKMELEAPLTITDEAALPVDPRYAQDVQQALERNKKK